ncbi:MAG: lipoyl(octanoyl) transferase LipB [Planctomycetota bacterium]|nr:lipoyl(octanoyl) transferase LipB [Planctomycetota bacterium]
MRELEIVRVEGLVPWREGYARQQAEAAALLDDPAPRAKLILLQHAPVYTLGRMTRPADLLGLNPKDAPAPGAPDGVEIDRGGSVTYHGPGQLTAYLLLHLKRWECSIHEHLWNLEETAIRALAAFGLQGRRIEGMTGVWCRPAGAEADAKFCAIGVASRRWMTYHGLGLNVDLDLAPFERIDPCGLGRKPVTSLARLLGRPVAMREAEDAVVRAASEVLNASVR